MPALHTPRLTLFPATMEVLEAELASPEALGRTLGVDVPSSWPPELYDADAVRWAIGWLADHHDDAGWCLYYMAAKPTGTASGRPLLVGVAGYKGAPDVSGVVEIGYGVVPECRRRGFASEAVRALLDRAFAAPHVTAVIAQTLPGLDASIGVLRGTGFAFDGPGNDPHEPTAIRFVLSRDRYDAPADVRAVGAPPAVAALKPAAT